MRVSKNDNIISESIKVIKKLIDTYPHSIREIHTTKKLYEENQDLISKTPNCSIILYDPNEMKKIKGEKFHKKIIAVSKKPKYSLLDELGEKVIILNGLTSPENVGAIIRTAAGLDFKSVIFDDKCASPYLRRCIRVSMGNIFYMKVSFSSNLLQTISTLKKYYQVIGSCASSSKSIDISNYSFTSKTALVIGSEGEGIEQAMKENCTSIVKIAIDPSVAHLNASQAAGILMYEVSRQLRLN